MIELCCEYLSVRCIWLYVLVMSCTHFRVNLHSIFAWMSRNSLLETGAWYHADIAPVSSKEPLMFRQMWSADSLWNAYVTWQEHTDWIPISTIFKTLDVFLRFFVYNIFPRYSKKYREKICLFLTLFSISFSLILRDMFSKQYFDFVHVYLVKYFLSKNCRFTSFNQLFFLYCI